MLLAAHVPAWLSAAAALWGGESNLFGAVTRTVTLGLACALFVLKIADVAWLRWQSSRRALIALSIIVALLHADVLRRWSGATIEADISVYPVAVLLGGLLVIIPPLLARWERRRFNASRNAALWIPSPAFVRILHELIVKLHIAPILKSTRGNRAPPILAS